MNRPDKFQNKYRISSARLQDWNYGWNAAYFVTICTKNREHFFGDVVDGQMNLSEIGQLAYSFWEDIPDHFQFVLLDAFVVMPNHIHGIILIDKPETDNTTNTAVETRHCLVSNLSAAHPDKPKNISIGQRRFQNQGQNTLSSIIGSYKSVVSKFARRIHADFAWQTRFHDHIIRNNVTHKRISDYIMNNPYTWPEDVFYR